MSFAQEKEENSSAEASHQRKPLPSREEIAKLPPDGGKEYNRLIFEQSPYLLQHAGNPVDWYPWGEEAFEKAKKEGKPVFLSIGYTTCHWCHVMEHESFEDEEVAKLINEKFVPVKVDREERPDIDEVYMTVTQGLTGRGGWPMTVVMTPEKKPFFAGTYYPKETRGMTPGIMDVLEQLSTAWETKREDVVTAANNIAEQLQKMTAGSPGETVTPSVLGTAFNQFSERYDSTYGGFSSAPKFPVPPDLLYLLRHARRNDDAHAVEMVEKTLTEIRKGGIYDQVGFGIHRYSTDAVWLAPHFEKMLYDQALIVMAYVEAYQYTGKEEYADTAREILTYVLRDMTSPEGGFYSAEDADSEGEEGKFYVWTTDEVKRVLGEEDGNFFIQTFNLKPGGNYTDEATQRLTGASIPHLKTEIAPENAGRVDQLRQKLFDAREKRVHPQKDDKILTDWNGLMIAAFARAGQALDEPEYISAAQKAANFVLTTLKNDDGRLLKRYRQGEAGLTAHLEDYAFMIWGLTDLYEATFDPRYLSEAITLADDQLEHFWDEEGGAFFMTADDAEQLLVRSKKLYGGAIPSGNAVSILNLTRLHRMTGRSDFEEKAHDIVKTFAGEITQQPSAFPMVLVGLDFLFGPSHEVVISTDDAGSEDTRKMLAALRKPYHPNKVVLLRTKENAGTLAKLAPYTAAQKPRDGQATAYVCQNFACQLPTTDIDKMIENLKSAKAQPKAE